MRNATRETREWKRKSRRAIYRRFCWKLNRAARQGCFSRRSLPLFLSFPHFRFLVCSPFRQSGIECTYSKQTGCRGAALFRYREPIAGDIHQRKLYRAFYILQISR